MSEVIEMQKLFYLLLPVLFTAWVYKGWCGVKWEIWYATLRMITQLLLTGYALMFLFKKQTGLLGIGILLMMVLMSSLISIRPIKKKGIFLSAFLSIFLSGTFMLALIVFGVMELSPLYQPRMIIPIAGMIYSNAMNTISLSGERFFMERESGHPLSYARGQAFKAALIPNLNSFFAVGVVSLPGMMTGQILAGVSPLIAVRYQIMVMAMVLGSAGIAAFLFLSLQGRKTE